MKLSVRLSFPARGIEMNSVRRREMLSWCILLKGTFTVENFILKHRVSLSDLRILSILTSYRDLVRKSRLLRLIMMGLLMRCLAGASMTWSLMRKGSLSVLMGSVWRFLRLEPQ